jgi:ethanolaminephosphotransferase
MFSEPEIAAAKAYKYDGLDESIAVKLFYRRFWDYMINWVPIWVAPNVITFAGFLFEIISFLLSYYYSDGLSQPIPWWVALINGLFVFIYQTLDNLDGRQARRTKTSSALGQFFDHGCDAITGISELVKLCATFRLGPSTKTFYLTFLMAVGFIITSWEEYVTHHFHLGMLNAPDEGLGLMAVLYIVIAIVPEFADIAQLSIWPVVYIILFIWLVGELFIHVAKRTNERPELRSKAVQSFIPGLITASLVIVLVKLHPESVSDPVFIMTSGYAMTYVSQILIVARLTDRPIRKLYDLTLMLFWILFGVAIAVESVATSPVFWRAYCTLVIGVMVVFDIRVVHGFATGLGIHPFKIIPKTD